ncbi:hypothetical protein [Arthrobacter sp. 35W]|uniref:hypothetical protein n=1 Tax=Arthrobacter sp. 35W TaxID=1132441 RepID=UPI000414E48A|nr:hypothetical protein [Arthrobacter sp. 35W]
MKLCFRSSVRPGLVDGHRRRHAAPWPAETAILFPTSEQYPDEGFVVLEEVSTLEDQLARAAGSN